MGQGTMGRASERISSPFDPAFPALLIISLSWVSYFVFGQARNTHTHTHTQIGNQQRFLQHWSILVIIGGHPIMVQNCEGLMMTMYQETSHCVLHLFIGAALEGDITHCCMFYTYYKVRKWWPVDTIDTVCLVTPKFPLQIDFEWKWNCKPSFQITGTTVK